MIVPMKKVSLFVLDGERKQTLKLLRQLGLLHIRISEGNGTRLTQLQNQRTSLEHWVAVLEDKKPSEVSDEEITLAEALDIAHRLSVMEEEEKQCLGELSACQTELDRLKDWGEIDPKDMAELAKQGIHLSLCELSPAEYSRLDEECTTIVLHRSRSVVRFAALENGGENPSLPKNCRIRLPENATGEIRQKLEACRNRLEDMAQERMLLARKAKGIRQVIAKLEKEISMEIYSSGMERQNLSDDGEAGVALAYFTGYLPVEDLEKLQNLARENAWGLLAEDPTPEDDVPTKLHNNKFISLIYPLTDFIGTVPGYFEYDISGWFLGFILVFFGIIFGDGGYGLLICAASGIMLLNSYRKKGELEATWLLVALLGGATVLWGFVTCTWFGIPADQLPLFLQKLSVPVLSNVYADKIWFPFWTNGEAGLTTTQNVQIFCFALALIQLSVAHLMGAGRNRGSLKILGDIGSVLQLLGMFYVVLSLVVNSQVFGLGLVIAGIPVGILAIVSVVVGFVLSFVFANYEGSIGKSLLASLKNIVSVLLGVVNVFSDIVSYIRLWAVGLAGSAISATVNDLAGPLFGNFLFMIFAVLLLVFGHGLNMILNVLSVIVHGVRLNTLEFSSHLDMSWSGHKYEPFRE